MRGRARAVPSASFVRPRAWQVYGTELYDHTEEDSVENVAESRNVVVLHAGDVVKKLSKQLHAGWRAAL